MHRRIPLRFLYMIRIRPFDAIGALYICVTTKMWLLTDYGCCSDRSRSTGSAPKLKEMTGSGIFKAGSAAAAPAASRDRQVRNFWICILLFGTPLLYLGTRCVCWRMEIVPFVSRGGMSVESMRHACQIGCLKCWELGTGFRFCPYSAMLYRS